jgi:hypothetical protein
MNRESPRTGQERVYDEFEGRDNRKSSESEPS